MPVPRVFIVAAAALLSSCSVREEYSVAVGHDNGVSLEKKEIVSSWWGEFPKQQEDTPPRGSTGEDTPWTVSGNAADDAARWKYNEDQREGEHTFRRD